MKWSIRILTYVLVVMLIFISLPTNVEAASKVKINKTKATIYVGKTATLKVSGTSKTVKWTTSNKKVATVSSKGKVTAKKAGSATITAKVSGKSYKCKVTVKNPYINTTSKTLYVSDTYTLKLTGTTIKTVKSSNPEIATINTKGKVTAKKAGNTTITLTGKDKKSYKCNITVKEKAHVHSYIQKVIEPTCTEKGYTLYTCSCGAAYKDNYTDIIDHTWSEWTVTKEATDTENGTETRVCSMCNKTETKDIPKTEHIHDYVKTVVNPSMCGEQVYVDYKCACGHEYTESYFASSRHEIEEWRITKDPGVEVHTKVEQFGERKGICSVCGVEVTQSIVNIDASNYEANKDAYADDVVFVSDNVIQVCGTFRDIEGMELGFLTNVNRLRKSLGLERLKEDKGLEVLAKIRIAEIRALYSHERPSGNMTTYVTDQSLGTEIAVGENFIRGTSTNVVEEMKKNPEYYGNMINENYTRYCDICFQTDKDYFWIQLFY